MDEATRGEDGTRLWESAPGPGLRIVRRVTGIPPIPRLAGQSTKAVTRDSGMHRTALRASAAHELTSRIPFMRAIENGHPLVSRQGPSARPLIDAGALDPIRSQE